MSYLLGRFLRCRTGVMAVEFALVAPMLILMLIAGYETESALTVSRKVTTAAQTVANLTTQYSTMSENDVMLVLESSRMVLQPYSMAAASLVVTEVGVDAKGNATVTWSRALNADPRAAGSSVNLQSYTSGTATSVILGEVTYTYTPSFTGYVIPKMTLYRSVFMVPRLSTDVPLTN